MCVCCLCDVTGTLYVTRYLPRALEQLIRFLEPYQIEVVQGKGPRDFRPG